MLVYKNASWQHIPPNQQNELKHLVRRGGWMLEDVWAAENGYGTLHVTRAFRDEHAVGWAAGLVSFSRTGKAYKTGVGVFVAPDERKHGVARELLRRFVKAFRRRYRDEVILYASPVTQAGVRLYARHKVIRILKAEEV